MKVKGLVFVYLFLIIASASLLFISCESKPTKTEMTEQEMIKRGILWGGFHNMSFSHSDSDIEYTLKVYREVLPILKKAVEENNVD